MAKELPNINLALCQRTLVYENDLFSLINFWTEFLVLFVLCLSLCPLWLSLPFSLCVYSRLSPSSLLPPSLPLSPKSHLVTSTTYTHFSKTGRFASYSLGLFVAFPDETLFTVFNSATAAYYSSPHRRRERREEREREGERRERSPLGRGGGASIPHQPGLPPPFGTFSGNGPISTR